MSNHKVGNHTRSYGSDVMLKYLTFFSVYIYIYILKYVLYYGRIIRHIVNVLVLIDEQHVTSSKTTFHCYVT